MPSRSLTRLLAVLLPAGLVLAGPAAHADRLVTQDAAGDVLAITFSDGDGDGTGEEQMIPAPDVTTVDITRTVVQHRPNRLTVTVGYRDLEVRRGEVHLSAIRVQTPRGGYWVHVGNLIGKKMSGELQKGPRTIECEGLRWSVDERSDKVTASVPTTCIGAPRWVQVGTGAITVDSSAMTPEAEQMIFFADDGHRASRMSVNSIAKGAKVFAG